MNQVFRTMWQRYIVLFAVLFVSVAQIGQSAHAEIPLIRNGMPSLAPVVDKVKSAVVNISTTGEMQIETNPLFDDPFFRRFFEMPEQQPERTRKTQSLGSGVIVDAKNGYVVTNHHVVEHASEIVVGLDDGRELKAKMIGSDPDSDVAVIQIESKNLIDVQKGDSSSLQVGDYVMAIGSPFGLHQTVTTGIVSALGRSGLNIERLEDFIQTDASINPGNSGGALINLRGELVGINTAILSRSGGNVGIGFAIPINMVDNIVGQLVENGEVRRGLLGVSIRDINEEIKDTFGIEVSDGALVTGINQGSAAEKAGIELGDVITRIDDVYIKNSADLVKTISLKTAGDEVEVELYRGKKVLRKKAVLDNRNSSNIVKTSAKNEGDLSDISDKLSGIIAVNDKKRSGVRIVEVAQDSQAAAIGLQAEDLIITVNRARVNSISDINNIVKRIGDTSIVLTIVREGRRFFAVLE